MPSQLLNNRTETSDVIHRGEEKDMKHTQKNQISIDLIV